MGLSSFSEPISTSCGIHSSYCYRHNVCINGVFYYIELVTDGSSTSVRMVICFDARSEKFSFVKFLEKNFPLRLDYPGLLDCNGKLALVLSGSLYAHSENIEMWVLQDPGRHEWSKLVYILPSMWKDVVDPKERLEILEWLVRMNLLCRLHIHLSLSMSTTAISKRKL